MKPEMNFIKQSSSWLGEEEIAAATRVLQSQVVNMGEETKKFEEELRAFFKRDELNVSCVNSCTAAIQLAVQACDIKQGSEILVPTYTFVSTFQSIKSNGIIPVPCDIDLDDGFINLQDAQKRITNKTMAIMPVLFAGCDQKISKVYDFAKQHNLTVIEDAAHSLGDEDISKRDGILCFSFDPIKNITSIDGGAIVTSNKKISERVKDLRLLGVLGDTEKRFNGTRSWDFDVVEQGWRYHMNNLCAAIGRAQLSKFDKIKEKRQWIAQTYIKELSNIDEIRILPIKAFNAVPHIFPIVLNSNRRDELRSFLHENDIDSGVQYKPNHLLSYFNLGYELPNSVKLWKSLLSLPIHPHISEDEIFYVIEKVKEFLQK